MIEYLKHYSKQLNVVLLTEETVNLLMAWDASAHYLSGFDFDFLIERTQRKHTTACSAIPLSFFRGHCLPLK